MILTTELEVSLNTITAKHFRELGYEIPVYENVNRKMVVKRGTKIVVRVCDLPKESVFVVEVRCDSCGDVRLVQYRDVRSLCSKCSSKINHHVKDGLATRDGSCEVCGKTVLRKNKMCWECFNNKKRHPKTFCVDCGKEITFGSKRCCKCHNTGKNNPAYNPDLTDEERLLKRRGVAGLDAWRDRCVERDRHTCVKCGYVGYMNDGVMHVHHVENFKTSVDKRTDDSNGVTMCSTCHKKFHKIYGKRKNTKNELDEFLKDGL